MSRAIAIALCLSAAPISASADVSGLQVRMTDSAAEIVVISADDLGAPRVRTQRGEVEVWFPSAHDNSRITASGDGAAVYRARLRPGVGTSAVLDIDIGGHRKLETGDVTIERQEGATVVRLPRHLLVETRASERAQETEAKGAPTPSTQATSTPATAGVAPSAPVASPVAVEVAVQRQERTLGTKPATNKTKDVAKAAVLAGGGESKLPTLITMTLVLAAILAGIKWWQRKSGASLLRQPDIEVVAHKRLAPGLQLYIVRAFGQEHLLSVNGKSTERIATNETFDDALAQVSQSPNIKLPNEPGVELIPSRSVLAPLTEPKRSVRTDMPSIDMPLPMPIPRTPLTTQQSIAGLIRLREEMDRAN